MFNHLTPTMARALSMFIIMLVLSIIIVSASYVYMNGMNQDEQSAKRAMRIWQSKINNSVENNQLIDSFETHLVEFFLWIITAKLS